MTFYEELFRDFDKAGVRYLVVGGVAVNLHGFVRMTADLDLIVALDPENLRAFLALMKSKGYKPKVPVPIEDFADPNKRKNWIIDKEMKVFSLYHPPGYCCHGAPPAEPGIMKEEWNDKEREPRRIVQMFDPEAQAAYKDWTPKLKLEWLASILKMYWSARTQAEGTLFKAAESRKPYPEK